MKSFVSTAVITTTGAAAALLLVASGIAVALSATSWGKAVSGQTHPTGDFLHILSTAYFSLAICVFLPTVLIVGFAVGRWAKLSPLLAGGLAIFPIVAIASGFRLEFAWVSAALLLAGITSSYFGSGLKRQAIAGKRGSLN